MVLQCYFVAEKAVSKISSVSKGSLRTTSLQHKCVRDLPASTSAMLGLCQTTRTKHKGLSKFRFDKYIVDWDRKTDWFIFEFYINIFLHWHHIWVLSEVKKKKWGLLPWVFIPPNMKHGGSSVYKAEKQRFLCSRSGVQRKHGKYLCSSGRCQDTFRAPPMPPWARCRTSKCLGV